MPRGDSIITSLLDTLASAGRPGRELAVRLDLLRSVGIDEARRRRGHDARLAAIATDGRRPGYRELWSAAAHELGADVVELGGGFLEFRLGDARGRAWNHWVALDDIVTQKLAADKARAHRIITDAGLPVPDHATFLAADLSPALAFLAGREGPCVVKPVDAAGGSGTTPGVRTSSQLKRARMRAGREHPRLLIEAQEPGDVYRLLFLDGALIGAIRRLPPRVLGDGRATIAELIDAENERRHATASGERPWLLRVDLDAVLTLENAGLTLSSVPARGTAVAVKTAVSQNAPRDNETVGEELAGALVAQAAAAVRALGVRLAGVDLITSDPGRALIAGAGVILEVNATPGLHYHYDVRDPGDAVRVMVPILAKLLGDGRAQGSWARL